MIPNFAELVTATRHWFRVRRRDQTVPNVAVCAPYSPTPHVDAIEEAIRSIVAQSVPRSAADKDATSVSLGLLEDWLSPEQRDEYKRHYYFHVIGNDTGTKYRIRDFMNRGETPYYNVDRVEADGSIKTKYCFEPKRMDYTPFPVGDVLLTQKIALERDEYATLQIANKSPVPSVPYEEMQGD